MGYPHSPQVSPQAGPGKVLSNQLFFRGNEKNSTGLHRPVESSSVYRTTASKLQFRGEYPLVLILGIAMGIHINTAVAQQFPTHGEILALPLLIRYIKIN